MSSTASHSPHGCQQPEFRNLEFRNLEFRNNVLRINHSDVKIPHRVIDDPAIVQTLRSVAAQFTESPINDENDEIVMIGPASPNSANFRVVTWSGQEILLRRCDNQPDLGYLNATAELIAQAREQGAPLTKQIRCRSSESPWVASIENKSWIAFEYIPAPGYFSGITNELSLAGAAIGKLHYGLEMASAVVPYHGRAQGAVKDYSSLTADDVDRYLLLANANHPNSFTTRFLQGEADILRAALTIQKRLEAAIPVHQGSQTGDLGLIRFDLHPHNILSLGDKIVIVDYDCIHRAPLMSDVGFALHRLGRQALFHSDNPNPANVVEQFLSGYRTELHGRELRIPELLFYGLNRGLQSVKSVLDTFYIKGDLTYAGDLPKFIVAAREMLYLVRASPQLQEHIDPRDLESLPDSSRPFACG